MNKQNEMKTEFGVALLVQAFPLSLREEAQVAASVVVQLTTASQWTEQVGLFVKGEEVLLPSRLRFVTDRDSLQPGSNQWLMVRCLQSRSNDGFQRQRAARDLLTDLRPWTAPFIVTLIGEYIAKIFIETKRRPLYFVDQVSRPGADGSPVGQAQACRPHTVVG